MLCKRFKAIIFRNFKRYNKYLQNKKFKKNVLDFCKGAKNQSQTIFIFDLSPQIIFSESQHVLTQNFRRTNFEIIIKTKSL
jgi:hypothetical protein